MSIFQVENSELLYLFQNPIVQQRRLLGCVCKCPEMRGDIQQFMDFFCGLHFTLLPQNFARMILSGAAPPKSAEG